MKLIQIRRVFTGGEKRGVGSASRPLANLDFTEARDSEWQLGHMQVCTSLPTDNHASTAPLNLDFDGT